MDEKLLDRDAAGRQFGESAVGLARALSQLGRFGLPADWTPDRGLESSQAEALRNMLVAVVGDVRLGRALDGWADTHAEWLSLGDKRDWAAALAAAHEIATEGTFTRLGDLPVNQNLNDLFAGR